MAIPDFILELREHIGHRMLWLPSVSAVVFDHSEQNILLAQRADNGAWAVISGVLEPGEHPGPAIQREIKEEAGIDVALLGLSSVDVSPEVVHANGDQCQYLDLCFAARAVGGVPHLADDENIAIDWFSPVNLPAGLTDTSRRRIERAITHRKQQAVGLENAGAPWFRR